MAQVTIVGDGPGGLCAALFLAKNGHDVVVYGRDETPMHHAHLFNYLGIEDEPGSVFQARARRQVEAVGAELREASATSIEHDGQGFRTTTDSGETRVSDYVIVAAGKKGTELMGSLGIVCEEEGVAVDREGRTTVDRLYAVGRIANLTRSQAIISAGMGAAAALDILAREAGKDVTDWDQAKPSV